MLGTLSPANQAVLTGRSYFPDLISSPFRSGLREAFLFGAIACLVAAAASWSRGGRPAALSDEPEETVPALPAPVVAEAAGYEGTGAYEGTSTGRAPGPVPEPLAGGGPRSSGST